MRSSYLIVPLVLLLIAVTVPAIGQTTRIMPCGDSITYDNHSGDSRPEGERISYRYPLWQLLTNAGANFEFVGGQYAGYDIIPDPQDAHNEGWPGWTDDQVAGAIYGWLVANPADIVLLHIGTNSPNSDPGQVEDILDEIDRFESDHSTTVHVVLAKIINTVSGNSTISNFNTNIETMALARAGDLITIVDMEYGAGIVYGTGAGGDMIDNLHPTDDGYGKMAFVWFEALQALMPDATLNCAMDISNYWMMEKEFAPYVNQFGMIARSTNPPSWTDGRVGYGQLFDYTNEVDVEDDDSLDWGAGDSFTMEFWMLKTNPVHGTVTDFNEVILGRDDSSTSQHWWLGVGATTSPPGKIIFQLRDNNNNGDAISGTTVVQDGAWHHVAAVRDGATGTNYLYVDGAEEASMTVAYPGGFTADDVPLNVGWLNLASSYYHYDGILDEVAFYDRALDSTEILSHYAAGAGGMGYCSGGEFAPVITSMPVTDLYSDTSYSYDVQAVGNPAPDFALLQAPAGMTIDPVTGLIFWMPSGTGDFTVEVEASNSEGSDTQLFTLSVTERPDCPADMISYWKLEETSGTTYEDFLGALQGQALVSPPTPTSPGIVGDCQDFNGTSDFITVDDDPLLDWGAETSFTIELWFNATNVSSRNKVMIGRDEGGGTHWWLGLNQNTGYANWNLLDSSRTGAATTGSTSLHDGAWHHLVAVRDELLNQNRLYVDGGLVDTATYDYGNDFGASTSLGIGYMAYSLNPDYYYDGLLDEIALYDRPLTEPEIIEHWNGGAGMSYCVEDAAAPVIVSSPVTTGQVGNLYTYDVDATGNPAPIYSLTQGTPGMTMDPVTGVINWTPTSAGIYDIEVQATNSEGMDNQGFTINVSEGDDCPADINAYWKLDEDPGPPFDDWVGTADGTCSGCPAPVAGLIGGAQWFDGATDEVNVPNSSGFDWGPDASFTIAYWMKTDQSTAGNRVLIGRDGDGLHMWTGCDGNGTARFQLKENNGDYVYLGGTGTVLNDNLWHYIVCIRDNSIDRNALYVDNELIAEATHNYTVGFASSAMLNIGYLNLGGRYRYHGALDDISIYDRALSPQEMLQQYQNGLANMDLCTAVAPAFISTPVTTATVGEPYTYDVDAVGNPGPTYALTQAPEGMTIDPVTGEINWVPAAAGPANVTVTATNSSGFLEQLYAIVAEAEGPFPSRMTAWWRLDETNPPPYMDTAGDNSIAANDLLAVLQPTPGKLGGAQEWNGLTDEVDVPDMDQFEWPGDASFTIEYWMKSDQGGDVHVMVGRDGGSGNNVHWWVGSLGDDTANFGLRDSANQYVGCASTSTIKDGSWHHIVAVRDGDLGESQIWVDGVMENSSPNTYAGDFVCNANLNLGYLNLSGHYRYPGILDEIAVYSRALTQAEIEAHYNGGAGLEYSDPIEPAIHSAPVLAAYEGLAYTYDVESIGVPTAVYGLTDPPTGMTIDYVTGIIDWTAGSPGTYPVTVTATNSAGTDTQVYSIVVATEPQCPPGMTNYWKLDETEGSTYADFYSGLDGTASSNVPSPNPGGIVGGAQYFNGSNNYITVPDDDTLDWAADQSFTIELWANSTESTGNNQVMIGRDQSGGSPHWWLGVDNSGIPLWYQLDTAGNGTGISGLETIWDGAWHHMVAVRDESLNENRLYVDGVLVNTMGHDYTAGFGATTTLGIGYMAYNGNPGYYYRGMLDEIALYGAALTPADIQDNYHCALEGYGYCDAVDLPPATPTGFSVAYSYLGNALDWDDNPEPDLDVYLVYRDLTAGFTPGPGNLVATVATSEYYDPEAGMGGESPFHVFYQISARDSGGQESDPVPPSMVSGVDDQSLPTRFALHGNIPNPFNPMTVIKYELPVATRVSLRIFDISGRLVAVLKNDEYQSAGRHEAVWRGRDQAGQPAAAGVYFYRMEGGEFQQTRRMVLVK